MRTFWLPPVTWGMIMVAGAPCCLSAQGRVDRDTGSIQGVNQRFDSIRQDPIAMLRELYEANRVLVLGERGHDEKPMYAILNALLREIGHDPQLKYIVVERPRLEAPLYEALSVADVGEADLKKILPAALQWTFCVSPNAPQAASMAAYNLAKFLPIIRSINVRRPASRPIRVTTVDGWILDDGSTREERTSKEFAKVIWEGIAPSEKAIVLYHSMHVTKAMPGNATWLGKFVRQYPGAVSQMAVVMIDWPLRSASSGHYAFSNRQAARYPRQSWGVRLAPFRGILPNTDSWGWMGPVSESFDAVVWWPNNIEQVDSTKSYLPIICNSDSHVSETPQRAGTDPVTRLFTAVLAKPVAAATSDRQTPAIRDSLRQLVDTTSLIRDWIRHVFDSLRQVSRTP